MYTENIFTQAPLPLNMAVLNITAHFPQANPLSYFMHCVSLDWALLGCKIELPATYRNLITELGALNPIVSLFPWPRRRAALSKSAFMLIKAGHTWRIKRQIQELVEHHHHPREALWYLIILLIDETSGPLKFNSLWPRQPPTCSPPGAYQNTNYLLWKT